MSAAIPEFSALGLATRSETLDLSQKITWYALLAMALLVPIAMSNWTLLWVQHSVVVTHDHFDTIKVLLQRVLGTIALVSWAWRTLTKGGELRWTLIDGLLLAFVGWVALSAGFSIHPPTALFGAYRRFEGLFSFINYAVVYFLFVQLAHGERRIRQLAQVTFASASLVSFYGVLQFLELDPFLWGPLLYEPRRAFSTYGNPVILGGFIALMMPVALALAFTAQTTLRRIGYWVGFLFIAWCWLATFTRGAWIGGAVGLAALVVGLFLSGRVKFRLVDRITLTFVIVVIAAIGAFTLESSNEVTNVARRLQTLFSAQAGSGKTRSEIWAAAFAAVKERPVIGFGADTFRLVFPKYKPAEYVKDAGYFSVADNAHNYPLQLASGVGIPGVLLFYSALLWAAMRSAKLVFIRGSAEPSRTATSHQVLLLGLWAGCAGYVVSLLFGISVTGATFLLWAFLGALVAPTGSRVAIRPTRWGTWGGVAVAGMGVVTIALWSVWFYADHEHQRASLPQDFRIRIAAANSAVRLNPYNDAYRTSLGLVYKELFVEALGQATQAEAAGRDPGPYREVALRAFGDAETALRGAIRFSPHEYDNHVALAVLYNLAGNAYRETVYFERAIAAAQEGAKIEPFGPASRYQMAWAYSRLNQRALAIKELEYALALDPMFANAALGLARLYEAEGNYTRALEVLKATATLLPDARGVRDTIAEIEANRTADRRTWVR